MKRVIREFFRSRHQELAQHYPMHDIVFIVKRGQSEITLATLERELKDVYEEDGFNLNSAIPRRGLPLSA
jgi:ribonuclease P protein component